MKTYIEPLTEIVEVKLENKLMAISGEDTVNSVSISGNNYNSENVTILSHEGGSIWDEEEEY